MAKKEKTEEKKVVKKEKEQQKPQQPKKTVHKYSLNELADLFGVSVITMRSMYKIRGLDKKEKFSYDEANKKFNNIV